MEADKHLALEEFSVRKRGWFVAGFCEHFDVGVLPVQTGVVQSGRRAAWW